MRPLLLALLALPVLAHAQGIATDRPDFTEGATTVPLGTVQLEAGATATWAEGDAVVSGPEATARRARAISTPPLSSPQGVT